MSGVRGVIHVITGDVRGKGCYTCNYSVQSSDELRLQVYKDLNLADLLEMSGVRGVYM